MRNLKIMMLALVALSLLLATPLMAQRIHLDLEGDNDFIASLKDPNGPFGVPPNCSTWHELAPNECKIHHQDDYFDADGNRCLDPCDGIKLNGQWYHIVWVGWTIFCEDGSWTLENAETDPGDPSITSWFEVAPNYGEVHKMSNWNRADGTAVRFPNGKSEDGHTSFPEPMKGDVLMFENAEPCEVVRKSVDIIVEPRDHFSTTGDTGDRPIKPGF